MVLLSKMMYDDAENFQMYMGHFYPTDGQLC